METRPAPLDPPDLARARFATDPGPGHRSPFLDALAVILTWRRVVFAFTAGVVLVAVVYSLLAKPTYLVRASLLPKQEESSLMGLSSLVAGQFGMAAPGLSGSTSSTDILMTILESDYLRDRIIDRLDLIHKLKIRAKTPERAREMAQYKLDKMVNVDLTRRFSIFLEVRAPSAQLAADIANAYFEELDRLNQQFAFTSARQTRMFIEQRLAETRDSLSVGQRRLEQFQREHGMIALDEQARAEVEVASKLEAELIGLEAQLEVARQYSTGAFSKTRELEQKIAALRNRLSAMAGPVGAGAATDAGPEPSSGRFMIAFSSMPGLGRQLADLMLNIKTQEAVFTLLTTQYQQAKIDEARDIPTIQVLDKAKPPESRDTPRRKKNVMIGLALGLIGGVLLAFSFEYLDRALKGASGMRVKSQVGGLSRIEGWLASLRS